MPVSESNGGKGTTTQPRLGSIAIVYTWGMPRAQGASRPFAHVIQGALFGSAYGLIFGSVVGTIAGLVLTGIWMLVTR